jgi:hypothetical protein
MLVSFVLLSQAVGPTQTATDPTDHLRYERAVRMPPLPQGESNVCAVLDAAAFAHAASGSGDDLRLYRGSAVETPFTLLESEAAPEDTVAAIVQNIVVHGRTLSFDLVMPHRAYTMVQLHLAARDFLAEAVVSGAGSPGEAARQLGSFTLFDLSGEHLARSTELPLQEGRLPRLHVALRFWRPDGAPILNPRPAIVQGADVPPSREAQTLYTTVATTSAIAAGGAGSRGSSVATLRIPAHLPVERVRFVVDPAFRGSFLRKVVIGASPRALGDDSLGAAESVQGTIARVDRPAPSADAPAVHYASLAIDDTVGSNLREPAVVHVAVQQVDGQQLPLRAVELQMRERSFCFHATAGASYTLRYGDASLPAPVYDSEGKGPDRLGKEMGGEEENPSDASAEDDGESVAGHQAAKPLVAALGPERENPAFVAELPYAAARKGRPEMFWVGLLSIVTLAGALAAHRVRYEREGA